MEKALVLFLTLAGIRPSISPSTTFFSQKFVFFSTSIVVCSIYRFCASFTENIAVRLRFLLLSDFFTFRIQSIEALKDELKPLIFVKI